MNVKYRSQLGSKFSITLGDEFQGLLTEPGGILEIIQYIKFRMHPVSGRFGVGIGEITTPIDPEQSLGADGPAYHRARRMVEYLKKNERGKKTAVGDIRIEAEAGDAHRGGQLPPDLLTSSNPNGPQTAGSHC